MIKRIPCFLFCVLLFTFISGQAKLFAQVTVDSSVQVVEAPTEDTTASYDEEYEEEETNVFDTTLHRSIWLYSADSVRSLRSQKEFEYMKNLDSLLKKRQELANKKQKKQSSAPPSVNVFPIIEVILWSLLIGALLFVLYRIFLSDRGLFASPLRNKNVEIEEEQLTDDAYLDQQLQQAIKAGDYRLAIRFLYLQSLNKLADKGWLQLSPDKTNYQYVREVAKPHLKKSFSRITLHYEYAWYGDFIIEQYVFKQIEKEFIEFHQHIKQA